MDIITTNTELGALAARILNGIATDSDLSSVDRREVYAIKSDTSAIHVRGVAAPVLGGDQAARTRRFIASDETRDRMGDIIRVAGWRFDEFAKNPVALWGHDSDGFPIGKVHDWQAEMHDGRPVLRESISYFSADANPASEAILRMIDEGGLRAVSVGFAPLKVTTPKSEEQRKELGLGPYGVLYEAQMQLELSNCTIPANPNAILSKSNSPVLDSLDALVRSGNLKREVADDLLLRAALIQPRKRVFASAAVEKVEQAELDETYTAWRDAVNMSASELKAWDKNPCSRKASVDADAVIQRNLELLETPKANWDRRLVDNAKRTISFIARMRGAEQGEPVSQECDISKRDISLKNWAHDPSKSVSRSLSKQELGQCVSGKIPKLIDEHPEWEMDQVLAVAYSMCREGMDGKSCGVATTKAAPGDLKVGDFVMWDSSGGKATGEIVDVETEGKIEVPNSDFSVQGTPEDPAAMIKIYRQTEEGEYEETDTFVAHKFSTLTKVEVEVEVEMETSMDTSEDEESSLSEEMRRAYTALDERLAKLQDSLDTLHGRLDAKDIESAQRAMKEQATASLRSSEAEVAAAMLGEVVKRVAGRLRS